MKTNKVLSCLCVAGCWMFGRTFANSFPGDCSVVGGTQFNPENSFPQVSQMRIDDEFKHSDIIDLASLNVAFLNLQKNCCEQVDFHISNRENCSKDEAYHQNNADNVLRSFYLFDHIYDLQTRRLAGEEDENYLYKWAIPDKTAQERRTRINEVAESLTGTAPLVINNKYLEFWKVDPQQNLLTGFVQTSTKSLREYVVDMTTGKNLSILQRYDELTLGEKYENLCNISRYAYSLFNPPSQTETTSKLLDRHQLTQQNCAQVNAYDLCTCRIRQRIQSEAYYVEHVSIRRSNDLLAENITQFTNVYLTNRLLDLEDLLHKINASLRKVNRAVPQLTPICM